MKYPLQDVKQRTGHGLVRITYCNIWNPSHQDNLLRTDAPAIIEIGYEAQQVIPQMFVRITVSDRPEGRNIFSVGTVNTPLQWFRDLPKAGTVSCRVKALPLMPGPYFLSLSLKTDYGPTGTADSLYLAVPIDVISEWEFPEEVSQTPPGAAHPARVYVPHTWSQEKNEAVRP